MVVKRKGGSDEAAAAKSNSVNLSYLNNADVGEAKSTFEKPAKGPSAKELKEMKQQEKRAEMIRRMNRDKAKDSVGWQKKLGVAAALLLMCGAGFFQFLSAVAGFFQGSGVTSVDVADTEKLKAVLFSGEPWVVYCVNEETASQRLPKVLEDSAGRLWSEHGAQIATMNCWQPTESGRSVAERFNLGKKPPLSFFVANGNKPKTISVVGLSMYEELEARIKVALKAEIYRINTLKKWSSLCTSRKTCVVIGHKNSAQRDVSSKIFKPLLTKHRATKVVTLDTSFWQLKLEDGILATRSAQRGGGADVLCLTKDEGSKGANATYSGTFLIDSSTGGAETFLKACESRAGLISMEKAPKINARPTKPKKAAPAPLPPRPSSPSPSSKPKEPSSGGSRDHVGSRQHLDAEDPLFEAVDEDEEEGDEEDESDGEEVEI